MRNKGRTGLYKRVYFLFFVFYKNRTLGKGKVSSYTI